jgi:hypothetical protein
LAESGANVVVGSREAERAMGIVEELRVGGYLAIEHSNFRFCNSSSAIQFEPVATRTLPTEKRATPLFGRDNMRLDDHDYRDVIFRKER